MPRGEHWHEKLPALPRWTRAEAIWLAGLLEGEGCFGAGYPRGTFMPYVQLNMTDEDVVLAAAALLGTAPTTPIPGGRGRRKPLHRIKVSGRRAVIVMRRLQPLMYARRAEKIQELLSHPWSEAIT